MQKNSGRWKAFQLYSSAGKHASDVDRDRSKRKYEHYCLCPTTEENKCNRHQADQARPVG